MGVELLLIDTKVFSQIKLTNHIVVINKFNLSPLPARFKDELKPNTIYKLNKFISIGISFTNKTTFAVVHEGDNEEEKQLL